MKQLADIRHRVYELRTERGMTQSAFASFLGVSRQSVGFYESGERLPDASTLRTICEKCNVSADWLLGLPGEQTNNKAEKIIGRAVGLSPKTTRWLHDEVERVFSAKTPFERFSVSSVAAFLNYLVEDLPEDLKKIEEYTQGAIVHDAYDTPDRADRLRQFLESKDEMDMTMRVTLINNLGADIQSVGEKRDQEIDYAAKQISLAIDRFVRKNGSKLRRIIAQEGENVNGVGDKKANEGR